MLFLTEVVFDDFKPLRNKLWKKFNISPFTYEGAAECTRGDPFILNFDPG
jgi:hypothetical protein